jgi:hypothetical protein
MILMRTNINQSLAPLLQELSTFSKGNPNYDNVVRTVALNALADVKTRIHQDGKASDNTDIGKYSTTPIYVSAKENPGKSFGRPIGKTGRSKFASGEKKGQDHASRYFEKGYNEFKTAIGRNQIGKVNLSLSGQLDTQLTVIGTQSGYGLGWPNDEMFERAGHLEKKYGKKIWALSEEEKQAAQKTAQLLIKNAFS